MNHRTPADGEAAQQARDRILRELATRLDVLLADPASFKITVNVSEGHSRKVKLELTQYASVQ